MKHILNTLFAVLLVSLLGACERMKDKETSAELPETSQNDTLVLAPDSVHIDTTSFEGQDAYETEMYDQEGNPTTSQNGSNGPTEYAEDGTVISNGGAAVGTGTTPPTTASSPAPVKKRYVRPTQRQLQSALAADARRSSRMSLSGLRSYWLKRQHYYRRASKEVTYASGPTKIKISQEETKVETSRGKVKIEGNDIKVKPD